MNNYHHVHFVHDNKRDIVWQEITKYISQFIPAQSAVLDLGAGYCSFINNIIAKRKIAIDVWPEFRKHALSSVQTFVYDLNKGIPRNIKDLDVVFASNFLEHLESDAGVKIIHQIHNILNHRGRLILIQPNFKYSYNNYFDDYTHKTIYTHVSLSNLLKTHGFKINFVDPKFMPYSLNSKLPINRYLINFYLKIPSNIRPFAGQMLIVATKA